MSLASEALWTPGSLANLESAPVGLILLRLWTQGSLFGASVAPFVRCSDFENFSKFCTSVILPFKTK